MQTQKTNDPTTEQALAFAKALYEVHSQSKKNQVDAIKKAQQVENQVDAIKNEHVGHNNTKIEDYINFPKENARDEDEKKFKAQIGKYIMYVACGFASRELGKHRLGSNKGVCKNFRHFSDENFAKDLEKLVIPKFCSIGDCYPCPSTYDFFNVSKICWSRGRAEAKYINLKLSELARDVIGYCKGYCYGKDIKEKTKIILAKAMDCCKGISEECNKMYCKGLDFVPGYGWINPSWRLTMGHGGRYFKKGVDRLFGKMGIKCCTWNSFSHDQSKYDDAFKNLSNAVKPQTVSK